MIQTSEPQPVKPAIDEEMREKIEAMDSKQNQLTDKVQGMGAQIEGLSSQMLEIRQDQQALKDIMSQQMAAMQ